MSKRVWSPNKSRSNHGNGKHGTASKQLTTFCEAGRLPHIPYQCSICNQRHDSRADGEPISFAIGKAVVNTMLDSEDYEEEEIDEICYDEQSDKRPIL
jgi:hypothetical protein